MKPFTKSHLAVSDISFMELLSFPSISAKEENTIRRRLKSCELLHIDEAIMELTIQLRRAYRIKLPGAIIAATAVSRGLPLLTADTGFFKIDNLQLEKLYP
jgi:predicted nucleic acid-binding protein